MYDKDPNRMQGLILVKELLGVSANENRPLSSILLHPMPAVKDTTVVMDMLNEFQLGALALLRIHRGGRDWLARHVTYTHDTQEWGQRRGDWLARVQHTNASEPPP